MENRKYTITIAKSALTGSRCLNITRTEVLPREKYYAFLEQLYCKLSNGVFIENVDFIVDIRCKLAIEVNEPEDIQVYTALINVCAKGNKTFGEINDELNEIIDNLI